MTAPTNDRREVLAEDDRLPERFWDKVILSPSGCWRWVGGINAQGYGSYWANGRPRRAHRIAYEALVGPIPDGLQLDHLCRVRDCVRPDHLEPVSSRENTLRGVGPSAMHARQTHCLRGHLYDEANTYLTPDGRRFCRACYRSRRRPKIVCPDCGVPMAQVWQHRRRKHGYPPIVRAEAAS